MTTDNRLFLKNILQAVTPGALLLAKYLEERGISRDLQQYYKKTGWLKSLGRGIYYLPQEQPTWYAAIYTIQQQTLLKIHPGGLTSLSLQGLTHYIRNETEPLYLFAPINTKFPNWLIQHNWERELQKIKSDFLPLGISLIEYKYNNLMLFISSAERAILECLYLAPNKMDLVECYHILESLVNLRPNELQILLENCKSIKVKRLFLYMARKANHAWFKYLNQEKIELGRGARLIAKTGIYNEDYMITIPKEFGKL